MARGRGCGRRGSCPWGALATLAAAAAALVPALAQQLYRRPPRPGAGGDPSPAGRQPRDLRMDQAWLQVQRERLGETLTVLWLSDACRQTTLRLGIASLSQNLNPFGGLSSLLGGNRFLLPQPA